jgi:signal transduction histidine kinase
MKSANPGSRRKKIILYYILAVVLPGIILGYMAYRGIRNDQALREKENRRRLEMDNQDFFTAVDSSLIQFMDEQTSDSMPLSGKYDPSLLAFFVQDPSGVKKLITHQLLYLPAEMLSHENVQFNSPVDVSKGFRLEFSEKRFSEALKFYQDKILKTDNPAEKIIALVATARIYNKMNQPESAKTIYEEIRKEYSGNLLNGEIPLGLIAGLEILKINRALGEKEEMRFNSMQYLQLLLHPSCEYDENQFDLFYQSFKEIIQETDPVADSLLQMLNTQRSRTDYLIRILTGSDLITTGGNIQYKRINNEILCIPLNSPELIAMYLLEDNSTGIQTGMVIDFPLYLKSVSEKLADNIDPNSSLNLKIEDNNGKIIYSRIFKEGTSYISFPFPENLPDLKLLLSENNPGFVATLFKAGSSIYLFIFILIALFMILGYVFTIYAINTELRLNKMKSEFISNVSHELKSPLTSIRMMTEMLHHNRVETEERKSAYYSAMLEESEHLSHLIDNILDFSRIEEDRKKYDFIDLDMNEILTKFIESTREDIPESGFNILYHCPDPVPVIQADKDSILQVIYNLVDNAIKFSGTSRQIDINLFSNKNELLFCVKDYGIGIPVKDQERIFDRFYRADETQRLGIKGSGIGLTIVKKIIEAHKGYLTLESRPGEGSTFCVHLPVNKNTKS